MTLTLQLPQSLEQRLADEARRRGVSVESVALEKIEQGLPRQPTEAERREAIAMLESWARGERDEDPDDGYDLLKALDDNRPPGARKLFPPEMKGISW